MLRRVVLTRGARVFRNLGHPFCDRRTHLYYPYGAGGVHAFSGFWDMRFPDSVTEGSTSTTPTEQGGGGVGGGCVGGLVCWWAGGA